MPDNIKIVRSRHRVFDDETRSIVDVHYMADADSIMGIDDKINEIATKKFNTLVEEELEVPTKLSDLENDSDFVNRNEVTEQLTQIESTLNNSIDEKIADYSFSENIELATEESINDFWKVSKDISMSELQSNYGQSSDYSSRYTLPNDTVEALTDVNIWGGGTGIFAGNTNLVDLSDIEQTWDVSGVTNMNAMFASCSSFTSLDLSNWDVSSCTDFTSMFAGCTKLKSIGDISNWNLINCKTLTNMFGSCSSLTSFSNSDLSKWNVKNITSITSMFAGCSSLTGSINMSGWDVSSLSNAGGLFNGTNFTSINLSNWKTRNINLNTIASSLAFPSSLEYLDISGWDFYSTMAPYVITSSGKSGIFRINASNFKNLNKYFNENLPSNATPAIFAGSNVVEINVSGWDTSEVKKFSAMWSCGLSLKTLDLSTWDFSSAENVSSMFASTTISILDISSIDTTNITNANGMANLFGSSSIVDGVKTYANTSLRYIIIDSDTFKFPMLDIDCGCLNTTCKILVPQALLETYKTAENWAVRENQFDAIENYIIEKTDYTITVTPKE